MRSKVIDLDKIEKDLDLSEFKKLQDFVKNLLSLKIVTYKQLQEEFCLGYSKLKEIINKEFTEESSIKEQSGAVLLMIVDSVHYDDYIEYCKSLSVKPIRLRKGGKNV